MLSTSDVTIIVPVFVKTEESILWLDECLASACSQGADVVAYDDGSLVDITGILSKYHIDDFAIGTENRGAAYARNRCAEMVTTKLLFPLDCDDRLKPGAIEKLLEYWKNDVPVYCDFEKFGVETVPHYQLMDWDCSHLLNFVGFTSVNVLHSKAQWKSIGGWTESIDFYEDGEYNARLMGTYCAKRCPDALVEYRTHPGQRTVLYKQYARQYALTLLDQIRRYDMPCSSCGGGRKSQSNVGSINSIVQAARRGAPVSVPMQSGPPVDLPSEFNGKVLARYIGGQGKGTHYYEGVVTKDFQKVEFGDLVYVDPRDTRSEEEMASQSMYVRVNQPTPPAIPAPAPVPTVPSASTLPSASTVTSTTVPTAKRLPTKKTEARPEEDIPDISNMPYNDIIALDLTPDIAKRLLDIEQNNLERRKVLKYLKGKIDN